MDNIFDRRNREEGKRIIEEARRLLKETKPRRKLKKCVDDQRSKELLDKLKNMKTHLDKLQETHSNLSENSCANQRRHEQLDDEIDSLLESIAALEEQLRDEQLKSKALVEHSRQLQTVNEQLTKELAEETKISDNEGPLTQLIERLNDVAKNKYAKYEGLCEELQTELDTMRNDKEVMSKQMKEVCFSRQQMQEQHEKLSEEIKTIQAELLMMENNNNCSVASKINCPTAPLNLATVYAQQPFNILLFVGLFLCSISAVVMSKVLP